MPTGGISALLNIGVGFIAQQFQGKRGTLSGGLMAIVGIGRLTCTNALAGVGRGRSPLVLLPRICASSARLRIALVFAERGLPVLATVEDAEDVDHEVT